MKWKIIAAMLFVLLVEGCLGFVVAQVSGPTSMPPTAPQPLFNPQPPVTPLPASNALKTTDVAIPSPPSTTVGSPAANFANVVPETSQKTAATELTFERLAEELRRVRYRQKELKEQEATLLAKMAEKVEEKRRDFYKSQEELKQLQGQVSAAEELKEPRKTTTEEKKTAEEKKTR